MLVHIWNECANMNTILLQKYSSIMQQQYTAWMQMICSIVQTDAIINTLVCEVLELVLIVMSLFKNWNWTNHYRYKGCRQNSSLWGNFYLRNLIFYLLFLFKDVYSRFWWNHFSPIVWYILLQARKILEHPGIKWRRQNTGVNIVQNYPWQEPQQPTMNHNICLFCSTLSWFWSQL